MRVFLGSLGFLTTFPVGRDERSFKAFVENLWIMPITGAFLGFVMWVLSKALLLFDLEAIVFLSYFLVEGINHVDGLSDFFDSIFARDKVRALKDTRVGVGGLLAVSSYVLILYSTFPLDLAQLVISQSLAKSSMLLLLLRNEAAWEGMARVFRENVRRRDYLGLIFPLALLLLFSLKNPRNLVAIIVFLLVTLLVESYSRRSFGGISGDVLGASNCLTFAAVVLCLQ